MAQNTNPQNPVPCPQCGKDMPAGRLNEKLLSTTNGVCAKCNEPNAGKTYTQSSYGFKSHHGLIPIEQKAKDMEGVVIRG